MPQATFPADGPILGAPWLQCDARGVAEAAFFRRMLEVGAAVARGEERLRADAGMVALP